MVLFTAALLAACGEMRTTGEDHYYLRHEVKPGETLYSIAWRFGCDYREVAAWNRIGPPYTIYPGQELMILAPDRFNVPGPAPVTVATSENPDQPAAPANPAVRKQPPHQPMKPVAVPGKPVQPPKRPPQAAPAASAVPSVPRWQWPTDGKVVARFAAGQGRKGIDMTGRAGQPVRAAADGVVVYSGRGLIGYGNLVIVKHNEVFLSAYGHNRRLLVKEGDKVKQGATLGEMGHGSKGVPILHFEIRKNGKPIDPLLYLPDKVT